MAEHFSFGSWDIEPVPSSSTQCALARAIAPASAKFRPRFSAARLQFDSVTGPALSVRGLRTRRHCVYELESDSADSPALEVMVERLGRQEGWSVVGQVFCPSGEAWAGCAVELCEEAAGGLSRAVRTNEWGEFALTPANNGPWRLGLVAGGRRYDIAPVPMP